VTYVLPAGSIASLAPQTPGSILIFDASGNAAVRVPVASGRILTDSGPGLPPTWVAPREVQIDQATLTAAATYTSPTWAAGLYRKIILEYEGSVSAFSYFRLQANAVATNVYTDIGLNTNTAAPSNDSHVKGTNGFAIVGVCIAAGNSNVMRTEFWPLTTGRTRCGISTSMSDNNSVTLGNSMGRATQFAFNDTATDVTFVTMTVAAATMTGVVKLYGELA
jgi:hypothetical protein